MEEPEVEHGGECSCNDRSHAAEAAEPPSGLVAVFTSLHVLNVIDTSSDSVEGWPGWTRDAGHLSRTYMAADFLPSLNAKDAVVADPDQPMISASPASAQQVIPRVPFAAVGCAVRWLAERWPDPHNCEPAHDENRDHNFAPHGATVTTADVPMGGGHVAIRSPATRACPFDVSPDPGA